MQDKIFDTPAKREAAIMQLGSVVQHPGWAIIVNIIKANIEVLNEQLQEGIEGETIENVRHIRDKIKIHKEFINTPVKIIQSLSEQEKEEPDDDPYE